MIPWINVLLKESQNKVQIFDLRADAPLFNIQHPLALKARLQFENEADATPPKLSIPGWNLYCFRHADDLRKLNLTTDIITARPHLVFKALQNNPSLLAFDFFDLGAFLLSKNELHLKEEMGIHLYTLPYWAYYAVSPEIWGTQGKWIRFHERLQLLFAKFNLSSSASCPGQYHLKPEAQKLEVFGFFGTLEKEHYTLTFPWTFPLTGLIQLEKIVAQEF